MSAAEEKLVPFQVDLRLNVSDGDIMRNLDASKARGAPELVWDQEAPPKKETLYICGAGPSLKDNAWRLTAETDVMALNGAYRWLRHNKMTPHYFACLDGRKENVNFVEHPGLGTIHLLASQVHPDVYKRLEIGSYDVETFHLATAAVDHVFGDSVLKIGAAHTVGLTALILGCVLGYRKFVLLGYDSSFTDDKSHVSPQPWNAEQEVIDVWVQDRKYRTTHAMAQQVSDFLPTVNRLRRQWPDIDIQVIGNGLFYDFVTTNNHETSRERELSKYATAYEDPTYGMSKGRYEAIDKALKDLRAVPHTVHHDGDFPPQYVKSYLDISCGRGESLDLALKHGFTSVMGTETVDALCKPGIAKATLPNTGLANKSADVVSLIEVIEHLLPEDVEPALYELTRLARHHILISAATTSHVVGGVDLHPSARPLEEWEELFKKVWGDKVHRIHDFGFSPAWRVDL